MNTFHYGAGAENVLQMFERETEGNYLFLGKSGLKKADFAREQIRRNLQVEKLAFCPDYYEVSEEGSVIGVDGITDISSFTKTLPSCGKMKYCLVPYAQRLTPAASNALLKMIEESKNVIFVFTASRKLLNTVMSRVRVIRCEPLTKGEFFELYPDADETIRRFVCGRSGAYEKIMADEKLKAAAERLVNGIDDLKNSRDFLEIFSQVKEKDPNSFFELESEFVSLSLEYLSEQIMLHMCGEQKTLPYSVGECWTLMGELNGAMFQLERGKYGKNDFFALVRKLVG